MMLDQFGVQLIRGDEVAYVQPFKQCYEIRRGTILRFSERYVHIKAPTGREITRHPHEVFRMPADG